LLLSLVPPFYIVVPNKELANTLFSFDISISNISLFIPMAQNPSNMNMNINTDVTRGRSASSNINNSRESSTHLDTSSVPYHKRMKIQSDNTLWSEQVEIEKRDSFSLSYTISKKGNSDSVKKTADNNTTGRVQSVNNKVTAPNNISSPQGKSEAINNTNIYPP